MTRMNWLGRTIATLGAAAMMIGFAPATTANAADGSEQGTPQLASTTPAIGYDARIRVPVVESEIGMGALSTDDASADLTLPGLDAATSALLRISVIGAKQDTTVNVEGSPALFVAKGHDASQTVFAPVRAGKVKVSSNAAADARVEVVAAFQTPADAQTTAPGSFNAVDKPVTRADTAAKLGGDELTRNPLSIGVVGEGGVPVEQVRAAAVTATFDAKDAGNVTLAGQTFAVPAGRSVVSTVAVPDDKGALEISADKDLGEVRLDVRGWVAGSAQDAATANVEGGYVPSSGSQWVKTQGAAAYAPQPVELANRSADGTFALALVSADKPADASAAHVFTEYGSAVKGRARGAVVDKTDGALAQLDVVDTAAKDGASVTSNAAGISSQALLLGDVIGQVPDGAAKDVATTLDSPAQGVDVNLATEGKLTLEGTVKSAVAVDRVEVYADGNLIGDAAVTYAADGAHWKYQTAVPSTKQYAFSAKAVTRAGDAAQADRAINVALPAPDDTVINPQATTVVSDDQSAPIAKVEANTVLFKGDPNLTPGQIMSATPGAAAPKGFLRKVLGVQKTADGWLVTTEDAQLTDVIYQANIDQDQPAFPSTGSTVDESSAKLDPSYTSLGDDNAPTVKLTETGDAPSSGDGGQDPAPTEDLPATSGSRAMTPSSAMLSASAAARSGTWEPDKDLKFAQIDVSCYGAYAKTSENGKEQVEKKASCGQSDKIEKEKIKAKMEAERTLGASLQASFKGKYGVRFQMQIAYPNHFYEIFLPYVYKFKVWTYGDSHAEMDLKAWGAIHESFNNTLATIKGKPVTFVVGGVTITLTAEMQMGFEGNLDAKFNASYNPKWDNHYEYGVVYVHAGRWNPIDINESKSSDDHSSNCSYLNDLQADGTLNAAAGPWIKPALYLYDSAGVNITAKVKGQVDASFKTNKADADHAADAKVKLSLAGSLQSGVNFKLPLGNKELLKHDFKEEKLGPVTVYSKDWQIGQCAPDKDVLVNVTFTDPRYGDSKTVEYKLGEKIKLTQDYVEKQLGVASGTLDGIDGFTTTADGSGARIALGSEYTVPDKAVTLYVHYSKEPAPPADLPANEQSVVIGKETAFLVRNDGTVLSWGTGSYELGQGNPSGWPEGFDSMRPNPILGLDHVRKVVTDQDGAVLALKDDGTVWAWGDDAVLMGSGLASGAGSYTPRQVPGLTGVRDIVMSPNGWGFAQVYAVKDDNTVWAWGYQGFSSLGVGNTDQFINVPTQLPGLTDVDHLYMASMDNAYSDRGARFAIRKDGSVWAWGRNYYGTVGVGSDDESVTTARPVPGLSNVRQFAVRNVSYGGPTYVALLNDGSVKVWGDVDDLSCDGSHDNCRANAPVTAKGLVNVRQIEVAGNAIYALANDGTVKVWGSASYDGTGSNTTSAIHQDPVKVETLSQVKQLVNAGRADGSAGTMFAVLNNGTVKAWGPNSAGLLGVGDDEPSHAVNTPLQVTGLSGVTRLTVGGAYYDGSPAASMFALTTSGKVFAWGSNTTRDGSADASLLGIGVTARDKPFVSTPAQVKNIANLTGLSERRDWVYSTQVNYAIDKTGQVWSWGYSGEGLLGFGTGKYATAVPVKIATK
ncbi:Ig-like domain-containing protein [Bifidobacterium avesanii]|uniref:RCC1 repeat-containing protein n=1 Tax=Bifidobacterium avesanii TaxID=1798157 RepID=A0A7K3TK16_9BIFI|nr:Ig-like domain-containing protein [Bifidobacterium avesanii]KAB8289771.1 RCC1 repeat-containing protein [Bifidobacterium avesanii]NEG79069.1 hypothetical protein [Bifidobacterium avesanii]